MKKVGYNVWHQLHLEDDDISTPWYSFVLENIAFQNLTKKRILEIGCGRGGFANFLAKKLPSSNKIFACDYSSSAIEIGRKKCGVNNIEWKQENIMEISFPEASFDMVISCETIEHITNPSKAVKELYRILKPGGTLILTCPNYFNLFGIWCIYRWLIGKPFTEGGQPYVNYLLAPQTFMSLKRVGFKIEKFKTIDLVLPARIPKHFYKKEMPKLLRFFGHRTFYLAKKL